MPLGWAIGTWGTNTGSALYPAEAQEGTRGASVSITDYVDGDWKWYFNDVPVTAGTEYQFSDYYKGSPSSIVIRYNNPTGTGGYIYEQIATLPASEAWNAFVGTLTPPVGTISLTIFHLLQSVGSLTVDNFDLRSMSDVEPETDAFDKGYVSLTFDDGWMSQYTTARTILNTAGLKGNFNIITTATNESDGDTSDPLNYMDPAQVLELAADGHEIGAHSRTHPSLPTLSGAALTAEIQGPKDDLIAMGINPVQSFVYPYGEYSDDVVQAVKDAGYTNARTVNDGYTDKATDPYLLSVQNVLQTTTVDQVKQWIDTAIAQRTWLLLVLHGVDNTGDEYGTTPEVLQGIVDYLVQVGASVITPSQGRQMMP